MRSTAWLEGQGLYYSFTYAGISVKHSYLPGGESNKDVLISLLYEHPEGIILYYTGRPHAVLLTDYTNGVFYCADPANGSPAGRINIDSALAVTITNSTEYWYVSDPDCGIAPSFLLDPVVFNLDYYKSSYADLREAFGDNDAAYINHWVTDGAKKGRCASPCFYSAWYLNYYQDIEGVVGVGNYIGAIEHFVKNGISEGRMGSSEFYVGVYRENFLDLQQAFGNDNYSYFIHYINSGQKEGRLANERMKALFDPNGGFCSVESMPITSVANYGTLPVATKEGYTFLGWYTLREGGEYITADSQVRVVTHQTLYAHWANDCSNGHSFTYNVTTAPTTSASGVLTGTCSRCSATTTVTLPKLNTTDYTYAVTKAASCTATGTGRYTWKTTTYGTFYFDVTIAKTAHSYKDTVTAPTCTAQGYTTHTCSVCGDSYKDTYANALGHNWDNGVITTQPTEAKEGAKTFTCTRCGETRTESVPVLAHTHSYTAVVTKPTCTEKGYTTYTCPCGDSYVADYVAALGHNWDDGVITTKPTETTEGIKTFTCSRCGETRTEPIPATGDKPCDGGADCPSGKFVDVNTKEWYHPYVDYAVAHGLFGGTSENTFEPETAMTRAMLVTVLWRYEGQPEGYENTFVDVNAKSGSWYVDAVAWASAEGVVNGIGNGMFGPNGNITREQMATILFRYAEKKGIDTSKRGSLNIFSDEKQLSAYAKDAVQWAVAEQIINGSDGKLLPQGSATRAQVATILMRFIENKIK